jgi:hypothetical protein
MLLPEQPATTKPIQVNDDKVNSSSDKVVVENSVENTFDAAETKKKRNKKKKNSKMHDRGYSL